MKKSIDVLSVLMIGMAPVLLTSCEEDVPDNYPQSYSGPEVNLGEGEFYAFIVEDLNGYPVEIGVMMTEGVLNSLPDEMVTHELELPEQARTDFYDHITVEWNPHGHEPPVLQDLSHLHVHFYIIPSEERMAIGPNDTEEFANAMDDKYVPEYYILTEDGIPQMGAHWVDTTAAEFNGEVFTNTFLWGSDDGEFIFWEPMITREYLLTGTNEPMDIKQPEAYQKEGWYATEYKVTYSATEEDYTISLTDFEYHQATTRK